VCICVHLCFDTDRDNSLEECGLELFFSTDFEILGKVEHHELKAGGDDILVTDDNKHEYIRSTRFFSRLISTFLISVFCVFTAQQCWYCVFMLSVRSVFFVCLDRSCYHDIS